MRMNVFVDTEFTCFEEATRELISLGLVSEDGKHEFYVEITDHNADFRSDYVEKVIIPMLDFDKYGKTYPWACQDLKDWIDTLPEDVDEVNFIVDYVGDWSLMLPMLERAQPNRTISASMYSHAFLTVLHERGVHTDSRIDDAYRALMYSPDEESYYATVDNRQHHALVDAKANRHAFLRGIKAGLE